MYRQTLLLDREYEVHWLNNIPVALQWERGISGN